MKPKIQDRAWKKWLASRPDSVRKVAELFPPNVGYRIKRTGQLVSVLAYSEDGTMRVRLHENNPLVPYNEVFGLNPEDLEALP